MAHKEIGICHAQNNCLNDPSLSIQRIALQNAQEATKHKRLKKCNCKINKYIMDINNKCNLKEMILCNCTQFTRCDFFVKKKKKQGKDFSLSIQNVITFKYLFICMESNVAIDDEKY